MKSEHGNMISTNLWYSSSHSTTVNSLSYLAFGCHDKTTTNSNLGRKGSFQLTLQGKSSAVRVSWQSSRQELKQRPWRNAAYWLALSGQTIFLGDQTQSLKSILSKDSTK